MIKTRNTFLEFAEDTQSAPQTDPKLRRASTDPCIVSSTEGTESINQDEKVSPPETEVLRVKGTNPRKVFVGSLPAQCDERILVHFMSYFGTVSQASIKRNLQTGQSRRYGYVKFKHPPREEIYTQPWMLGDKVIRVKQYQVNPCWKNEYVSDSSSEQASSCV